MKTKMTSKTGWIVAAMAMVLALLGSKAQAQEGLLNLNQKTMRGSAIVETWGAPAQSASCRMASILGLCGGAATATARAQSRTNRLGGRLFGLRNLRAFNMNLTRINVKKSAPNKLFELVKMFIDDVEVAQIGDFKVKLSITFE